MGTPTRLPYGLGFIKPDAPTSAYTFVAGDQTPNVSMGTVFLTASSAITLLNFDNGELGKIIILMCNSGGAVTLQSSAGGILPQGIVIADSGAVHTMTYSATGNYVMKNGEAIQFVNNGTSWLQIGSSIRYSTQI